MALGECALILCESLRAGTAASAGNDPNLRNKQKLMVRVLRTTVSHSRRAGGWPSVLRRVGPPATPSAKR